jgi:alkylated DNA repair dioxygenase AlkB
MINGMVMDLFSAGQVQVMKEIPIRDGELLFMEQFLSYAEIQRILSELNQEIHWRQEQIKMYGKSFPVPRLTAWFGDDGMDYSYSGIKCNPLPWTRTLLSMKQKIEALISGVIFNSVLLNKYRNGNDKVSWHSDDEMELGVNPVIASISLGAARRFDLRHKDDFKNKIQLTLTNGSLIIMKGALQHNWQHQIPVQKMISGERVNLTFRNIIL